MKSLIFIYASTSGNTELVMEYIAEIVAGLGNFDIQLYRAEIAHTDILAQNSIFVFGTSTWEHGVMNPFFNRLYKEILRTSMIGKQAAFVGCGNSKYDNVLFCKGIDILKEAFLSQGGIELGTTLKIDGDPHAQLEERVKLWAQTLHNVLIENS